MPCVRSSRSCANRASVTLLADARLGARQQPLEGHGAQTRSTGLRAPLPRSKAKPKAFAATPASRPGSVADQQARVRGFALDLAIGGPDGEDAAFGRAA
jgi:hypothetical protein